MRKLLFLLFLSAPLCLKAQIKFNFENGNLDAWQNTQDWTIAPLAGKGNALKHNLKSVTSVSYISLPLSGINPVADETEWKFRLINGNFSPTSSNKFWFYLVADSSNLSSACNGYAVGVNFLGTKSLLTLWKVTAGKPTVVIETAFTWAKNQDIAVYVKRTTAGDWTLQYAANGDFSALNLAGTKTDTDFWKASFCGLYFKFTSSYAGLLSMDDLSIGATNQPPRVSGFDFISDRQVAVNFNEAIDSTSITSLQNIGFKQDTISIPVQSVSFDKQFPARIILTTSPFKYGNFSLSIQGVKDMLGLAMPQQTISQARVYQAQANDVVINEIMADPSPVVKLPEVEYLELYNRSAYEIDITNWYLTVNKNLYVFPALKIAANSYLIVATKGSETAFAGFVQAVGLLAGSALLNSGASLVLTDANKKQIDAITYSSDWISDAAKKDGGWAIEKIDAARICNPKANWTVSVDPTGGTPGAKNSVSKSNIDTSKPCVVFSEAIDNQNIKFQLSKEIDPVSLSINDFASDVLLVDSMKYDPILLSISFRLKNQLPEISSLKIKGLTDLCGNMIQDTSLVFNYYTAKIGDVVINEIMADPSPSIGLPVQRYIELHNPSNHTLTAKNWSLFYGTRKIAIPSFVMKPNTYLILCSDSAIKDLSAFGPSVGWRDFPALAASSGLLYIVNQNNTVLSWVNYQSDWHTDDFKKNGGWSLERIDPTNIGEGNVNWSSSTNKNGGTPGKENSVRGSKPDVSIPKLQKVIPITEDSLMLYFSEPVNTANVSLTINEDVIKSLNINPIRPSNQQITVKLDRKIEGNKIYTLAANTNFHDFAGNEAIGLELVQFALPINALAGEILLNEVLFNAKTGCSEFVELYNPTEKAFNLKNYQFAVLDDAGKIRNPVAASNEDWLLLPHAFAVLTDDPSKLPLFYPTGNQTAYIKMSLPTLSNDGAHLVLFDNKGNWIDDFAYSPDMHSELLTDQSGVSLERHAFNHATKDKSNWSSASSQCGFATPGYKNSQAYDKVSDSVSTFSLSPKVFSPDRDGNEHQLTISINLEQAGFVANIYIYDSNGLLMKRLVKHELLGTVNNWTWEGTDESGTLQKQGVYIVAAELMSTSGDVHRYKKACILARRL